MITILLLRHANIDLSVPPSGPDGPPLNSAGQERAETLALVVGMAGVSTIFTSSFLRTKQTVQPLAARLGIQDREVPPVPDLVRKVKSGEAGPVILIAGHSNTVPQMIEAFGVQVQVPVIGEREFDNLFVVTLVPGRSDQDGAERDEAGVLHLKYGKPSS